MHPALRWCLALVLLPKPLADKGGTAPYLPRVLDALAGLVTDTQRAIIATAALGTLALILIVNLMAYIL